MIDILDKGKLGIVGSRVIYEISLENGIEL
jgi:hypothetical protein